MRRISKGGRRPAVHITLERAARLHHLVTVLAAGPRPREELLSTLVIGLRTFYRELDLLRRCGVRIKLQKRAYVLQSTAAEAEGRLPFPDPQLTFAEMAELSRGPGDAARRLAALLDSVVTTPLPQPPKRPKRAKGGRRTAKG